MEARKVRDGKVWTVNVYASGNAVVYYQALNPQTGKGWQAKRGMQNFFGEGAKAKALVFWLKA
jgi:hypothetical protein